GRRRGTQACRGGARLSDEVDSGEPGGTLWAGGMADRRSGCLARIRGDAGIVAKVRPDRKPNGSSYQRSPRGPVASPGSRHSRGFRAAVQRGVHLDSAPRQTGRRVFSRNQGPKAPGRTATSLRLLGWWRRPARRLVAKNTWSQGPI